MIFYHTISRPQAQKVPCAQAAGKTAPVLYYMNLCGGACLRCAEGHSRAYSRAGCEPPRPRRRAKWSQCTKCAYSCTTPPHSTSGHGLFRKAQVQGDLPFARHAHAPARLHAAHSSAWGAPRPHARREHPPAHRLKQGQCLRGCHGTRGGFLRAAARSRAFAFSSHAALESTKASTRAGGTPQGRWRGPRRPPQCAG